MIKFKEFDVSDAEEMEQFQNEHPDAEFLQITGGHMSREKIWFKYDDGIKQPKLSIPKHIAEELDTKFADVHVLDLGYVLDQTGPYGSPEFDNYYFKNQDTIAAYMISKALGVNLVEVTE
ncbi:hypothetical protein AALM99_11830 [Lactococcus muris]|uniref:Phage protein n=1 Tax=Lactococcus muris TaxID=2941330 RepID=A0ABV4DBM9_9LACT